MPIYVFENEATGAVVEVSRLIAHRDAPLVIEGVEFRRRTVPERLAVLGHNPHPVLGRSYEERILKGYHDLEQRQGSDTGCEFSKKEIQKIWQSPPPPSA